MLVTAFLLLPVLLVLMWVYWYLLPKPRKVIAFDWILVLVLVVISTVFVEWIMAMDWTGAGPIWPHVIASLGAYVMIATGMVLGIIWRRRSGRQS